MTNTFNSKHFAAVIEKAIKNGHQVFFKNRAGSKLVVSWDGDNKCFMYDILGLYGYLLNGKYKIKGSYPDLYPAIADTLEEYRSTTGNVLIYGGNLVDEEVYCKEERIFVCGYRVVSEEELLTHCIFAKRN